jgi:predicted RNase H-like nuclease (RuvC/YqgF family)
VCCSADSAPLKQTAEALDKANDKIRGELRTAKTEYAKLEKDHAHAMRQQGEQIRQKDEQTQTDEQIRVLTAGTGMKRKAADYAGVESPAKRVIRQITDSWQSLARFFFFFITLEPRVE